MIGVDIEDMFAKFGIPKPDHFSLIIQDVLTLHGSQFKDAGLIVCSPPCQRYSWMAMPWKRAKAAAAAIRADETGQALADLNRLFDACFRIQAEASLAAGRHVPMVVENVRGAQPWVGRARWSFGSFYLWGDVPALMPFTMRAAKSVGCGANVPGIGWIGFANEGWRDHHATKNSGGSWSNVAHNTTSGKGQNPDGRKGIGPGYDPATGNGRHGMVRWTNPAEHDVGIKVRSPGHYKKPGSGPEWFDQRPAAHGSGTIGRKFASAMIARIPLPLARHIGAVLHP